MRLRDGGELGGAGRLSGVLGDPHKGSWAQKLMIGKEGLLLICVMSLNTQRSAVCMLGSRSCLPREQKLQR